jgi:hypothetical protein
LQTVGKGFFSLNATTSCEAMNGREARSRRNRYLKLE